MKKSVSHSHEDNSTAEEEITEYKHQVKKGIIESYPYDRLMTYYRKQKQYKEELKVIERGLSVFENHIKKQQNEMFRGTHSRASIKNLSDKISKSSGLTDKKGNPNYIPEPLARWLKRKETVRKRISGPL